MKSYVNLLGQDPSVADPHDAIDALRNGVEGDHSAAVLQALEQVVVQTPRVTEELEVCTA